MKLYRYRPITELLFKELLHQEIYLASYFELNDPFDMTTSLDFSPKNKKDIEYLAHFLRGQIFHVDRSSPVIKLLKDEQELRVLSNKLWEYITSEQDQDKIIDKNILYGILEKLYQSNQDQFFYLFDRQLLQERLDVLFSAFLENSNVACFSEIKDNFLMWSHYASRHRGICLEFDLQEENEGECLLPIGVGKYSYHEKVNIVKYVDKPCSTNFYDFLPVFANELNTDLRELSKSRWHPFANKLEQAYLYKLNHWEHEKEWRIVLVSFKEDNFPENRILQYNSDSLSGIIFGMRTDQQVKRRVYNIVRRKSKKICFYDAILLDGSFEIVPADENQLEYL